MRLESKFKDYYDHGLSYGIDPLVHYHRVTEELNDQDIHVPNMRYVRNGKRTGDYVKTGILGILGFCGVEYPFVDYRYGFYSSSRGSRIEDYSPKHWIFYQKEENPIELIDKYIKTITVDNEPYHIFDRRLVPTDPKTKDFRKIKIFYDAQHDKLERCKTSEIFEKFNVPIYAKVHRSFNSYHSKPVLILNPRLMDFNFQAVEPNGIKVFQTISQYISSLNAKNQMPLVDHDDKTIRDSKGFNKFSFRKDPSKDK